MLIKYRLKYKEQFSPDFDEYWQAIKHVIENWEEFYYLGQDVFYQKRTIHLCLKVQRCIVLDLKKM